MKGPCVMAEVLDFTQNGMYILCRALREPSDYCDEIRLMVGYVLGGELGTSLNKPRKGDCGSEQDGSYGDGEVLFLWWSRQEEFLID